MSENVILMYNNSDNNVMYTIGYVYSAEILYTIGHDNRKIYFST